MQVPLFDQVDDLVLALAPDELDGLHSRAHRRGLKVWFGPARPPREHYEAQLLPRRYVDGADGIALEIGFHAEHPDPADNNAAIERIAGRETQWRAVLGAEADMGVFFGADNWRRVSEAWVDPDLDDPELAFEVASRLVDYLAALEPARR